MRKVLILSIVSIFIIGAFAFAASIPVYLWNGSGWSEVATPAIASATATVAWDSAMNDGILDPSYTFNGTDYSILPGTPTWTQLPRIDWNLEISQWIYISISYTSYDMHIDLPGDYIFDNLYVTMKSNAGVYAYFITGGDFSFTDDNNVEHTIPTWAGYQVVSNSTTPSLPTIGLPTTAGISNAFWYDFNSLNDYNAENYITITDVDQACGCSLDETFRIWLGVRVGEKQCKGEYTTYADVFIQADP